MRFGLTEEQELLQETLRGFVQGECPPKRLRELFDAGTGHDAALWKGLAEMGIAGLAVPESLGGAGLEVLELALAAEVLGDGALPGPFLGHSLACLAIASGGSEAQQRRWLPALASGDAIGTVALAEEGEEWDPAEWALAVRDGTLSGVKRHVPHAGHADLILVGTSGGGFAVVERGAAGLATLPVAGIDRTRPVCRIAFDATACEPLEATAGVGARVRDAGLVLLAADAFGAAWRLTRLSIDYAKERRQFGQPIAQFQAVKHQLADMATAIEPTRGLYWYAAHALDHLPDEAPRSAAIAKSHITDRATEIARQAVEVHGGIGFTWECDVQMWFKRAMFDRAFLGTPSLHRERSAALGGW
jgi:alkylation response protein AidB-like acyl-CoA dehydrogenase